MAQVDHLAKLLEAVTAQNWDAARLAANHIVDAEEKRGHRGAADRLRGLLHPNAPRANGFAANGAAQPQAAWLGGAGFLEAALTRLDRDVHLAEVELKPSLRGELEAIVVEWMHRDELAVRGLDRRRKLLFHGPPGCGKSLSAVALANALGLPTFVVRMDAVVGAYLGQTALRVRELFRFAEQRPSVLLLDEIDALGRRRGHQLEVGELDRVVISLMQELEHTQPAGLVIATSNLAGHLDEALFRRFDSLLRFPRPTKRELERFARTRAADTGALTQARAARLVEGATSYAEAVRRLDAEHRAAVLRELQLPM